MYSSVIHGDLDADARQRRGRALPALATIGLHIAILLLVLFLSGRRGVDIRETAPLAVFDVTPQPIPPPVAPAAKPAKDRTPRPTKGGNAPRPAAAPVAPQSTSDRFVRPDVTFDATAPPLPTPTTVLDDAATGMAGLRAASGVGAGGIGTGSGTGTGDDSGGGTGLGGGGSAPHRTTWLHYPTPAETRRYWPPVALQERRAGRVLLSCVVPRPGPPKRCTVAAETPRGHGFGAAALQMSAIFLIRPVTRDDVTVDLPILVPIAFDSRILPKR